MISLWGPSSHEHAKLPDTSPPADCSGFTKQHDAELLHGGGAIVSGCCLAQFEYSLECRFVVSRHREPATHVLYCDNEVVQDVVIFDFSLCQRGSELVSFLFDFCSLSFSRLSLAHMAPKKVTKTQLKAKEREEAKAAKQQQKEQNQLRRNEQVLTKALEKFEKTSAQSDLHFITTSLNSTPAWIAPLARLIRQGAMNSLLRVGSAQDEAGQVQSAKWQGKAKTILELPADVLSEMLVASGLTLPADASEETHPMDKICKAWFWITPETLLPKHRDIRYVNILCGLAKARVDELGFKYWHAKSDFLAPMWEVEENILCWNMGPESRKYVQELPALPEGAVWELSDDCSPSCLVTSSAQKKISFECRSFFEAVDSINPAVRWDYVLADEDNSEAAGHGNAPSTTTLSFKVRSPNKA